MRSRLQFLWAFGWVLIWAYCVAAYMDGSASHPDRGLWRNVAPAFWFLRGQPVEATYIPSPIKSIQTNVIDLASATSNTATITSVNTAASALHFLGNRNNDATQTKDENLCRVALTNATTVTATRGTAQAGANQCGFVVIEYLPIFVKSTQANTINLANVASNTATITSVVTTKSYVAFLGVETVQLNITPDQFLDRVELTNATTVTALRYSSANASNHFVGFRVVEFR